MESASGITIFSKTAYGNPGGGKMFSEIQTIPDAAAEIKGSPEFPKIRGMVYFFGVHNGTIVAADYPQSA